MRIAYCTLGCKVNQYDTDAMRELLEAAGHVTVDFSDGADAYIINTCTVTGTGDKKSRQMISRAHALAPEAKIIVAGCYAQRAPEEILALPGVSLVAGTADRGRIVEMLASLGADGRSEVKPHGPGDVFEPLSATGEERTRAYLKIEDGCDRYCTYCIIPHTRGPVRSRPINDIRNELTALAAGGYKEAVLTGIHLMSYGKDLKDGTTLADVIAMSGGIDGLRRVRLGSLEPQLLSGAFVDAIAGNEKVCRQFHLSLQSGSDAVLRRMARRYSADEYAACVDMLRLALGSCAITTDVIVGFPGETDAEFDETIAFVRKIGFARVHVFPYSRRAGTPAYSMPDQVESSVKRERTARLIALASGLEGEYMDRALGHDDEVLFEERRGGDIIGHTGTYLKVAVECPSDEYLNEIAKVHLFGRSADMLRGRLI